MRSLRHVSYNSLNQYETDTQRFYLERLCDVRVGDRGGIGKPGAVGNAFDTYCKSALYYDIFGKLSDEHNPEVVLPKHVAPELLDWARAAGNHCLACYMASGAYDDLRRILERAEDVRFESAVTREIDGVPWLGVPDLSYTLGVARRRVVHDWKVRGYCSSASPHPGFIMIRDGFNVVPPERHTRGHGKAYKNVLPAFSGELDVNAEGLENSGLDWARQTAGYAWLAGCEVGDEDFLVQIDELVWKQNGDFPRGRVATHRGHVSRFVQEDWARRAKRCWDARASGHVFHDLSRAASDELCALLDDVARSKVARPGRDVDAQLASIEATYSVAV